MLIHFVLVGDSNIFDSFIIVEAKDEYRNLSKLGLQVIIGPVGAWVESYCLIRGNCMVTEREGFISIIYYWVIEVLVGHFKRILVLFVCVVLTFFTCYSFVLI